VIVLHGVIMIALLHAVIIERSEKKRETHGIVFLPLPPLPEKAAPKTVAGGKGTGAITGPAPEFQAPVFAPQALGFGQAVFGCQPENWHNLDREQQEKCFKLAGNRYVGMKDGLPIYVKPKGPEWEGLRSGDLRARERNTADPCLAAKQTGTECIHDVIYGKGLW
jgi:hypothetical protein